MHDHTRMNLADGAELPPQALRRRTLLQLAVFGGALAAGAPAWAQAGTPKRGGTLTIGADADPIGLDPVTVTAYSSFDFTSLLYTGLLRWDANMKVQPDLATGFLNPDETT